MASIRRLVLPVLIAGALCVPATAALAQASPPPPPPGIGVRLLQGPADNLDDPRAHEYIVDHLAPGTTISRQVGFSNGDAQAADLSFYADAAAIHDGAFEPGAGRAVNDLTTWTTFSPTSVTVQPGQTVPVTVTIAVPADATAGEHYGAALAERATPPAAGGVSTVSRVGIRIYLSVGPGGAPPTAFSIDSMTAKRDGDGKPFVTAQVHNTGGRAIDLAGKLDLTNGPSSLSAGPFSVRTVETLAPGANGVVTVPLDRALPNGPWDGRITLVSGLTSETVTGRLTFPSDSGTIAAPTIVVRADAARTPILVIAIVAILALLLLWLVVRRRRRRADPAVNVPPSNGSAEAA
jgi:hypothetical protein